MCTLKVITKVLIEWKPDASSMTTRPIAFRSKMWARVRRGVTDRATAKVIGTIEIGSSLETAPEGAGDFRAHRKQKRAVKIDTQALNGSSAGSWAKC
jgi:hypothetical protein